MIRFFLPVIVLGIGSLLLTAADKEKDWKDLFDGTTLKGWEKADYVRSGKVEVKDGVILLEKGNAMTGVTYTKGDFPTMDYEVTLDSKKIAGNDFFCTTTFPVGKSYCSLVVGGWGGKVVGLSSINQSDASENETRKDREFKTDQWYPVRIRVSQNRIECWIDGEKLVNLDSTDRRISTRLECNACQPFGICTYNTTAVVRGIKVRPLTEADKKDIAATKPESKE
jgi:hypothetical protein